MRLLIQTKADDEHAVAVASALSGLGHEVVVWAAPSMMGAQTSSLQLGRGGAGWRVGGRTYPNDHFDVAWLRRYEKQAAPNWMDDADVSFAKRDNQAHFKFVWSAAAEATQWIHSYGVALRGENKIEQLKYAAAVGLSIPETLMSNDPSAIRDFVRHCATNSVDTMFKTFRPMGWVEGDRVRPAYTTPITEEDLRDDELVRAVPAIYQARISKDYELRSTFFGSREYTVRIDSNHEPSGADDWRGMRGLEHALHEDRLPSDVAVKCLDLMRMMDLKVACFDFIVDHEGDHYFLELNQQGQFLWVEQGVPDLHLLRGFCEMACEVARAPLWVGGELDASAIRYLHLRDTPRHLAIRDLLSTHGLVDTTELCAAAV